MKVKAISIRQPWAWLIINGPKTIETRSKHCSYRGRLAIHASKEVDVAGLNWIVYGNLVKRLRMSFPLETGKIVGLVKMYGEKNYNTRAEFEADQDFHLCPGSRWTKVGYLFKHQTPFDDPISWRGMPGLFEVDI